MAKPCDCDKKPAGAPDDSIRNAAAMWTAAGKTAGFVEGVEWAIKCITSASPALGELAARHARAETKRGRMAAALAQLCQQLSSALADHTKQAANLNRMAVAMADRLESRAVAPAPAFRRRIRAALTALRG